MLHGGGSCSSLTRGSLSSQMLPASPSLRQSSRLCSDKLQVTTRSSWGSTPAASPPSCGCCSRGDNPAAPLGNWNTVFQPYLSFMCLCPAARPSLIACQVTQLISVLPRTVYLKDTQHSFLGIRISAHRREHSVPLNQLGTPVNTRIQLSYTNFTERKKPSTIMKINELPILYHVAILKALFTKLLPSYWFGFP